MNQATSAAAAAGTPITVTLGGVEYRVSPLRQRDYAELEQWLQDRIIAPVQRHTASLGLEERTKLLDAAFQRAALVTLTSPEAARFLGSLEGAFYLCWLSLRHNHPQLTLDAVRELLAAEEALAAVQQAVERFSERARRSTPTMPAKKKRTDRKQRRRL